jgi:hypothetical protein
VNPRRLSRTIPPITTAWWLVLAADLIAVVTFTASAVLTERDGVDSGALIIGIPPLAVAVVGSAAMGASTRWRLRWPLGVAIGVCGAVTVVAMTSFITPWVATTVPVCALLIAASIIRLSS